MRKQKRILAFDFDGVLCNSIHDSIMTAVNTYLQCLTSHNLPLKKYLKPQKVINFEKENPVFVKQFSHLIPLGNFAIDYFVILKIIDEKIYDKITTQEDFDNLRASISKKKLTEYNTIFYKYRQSLQQNNPEAWAELLPTYPGIPEAVRKLSNYFIPAIATSKDINSVNILLKKYKLSDLFDPDNILDKNYAETKRDHIIKFKKSHNLDYHNIFFIDDKVSHLIKVKDLNVRSFLALWGFNTEREQKSAVKHGISLLNLDEIQTLAFLS